MKIFNSGNGGLSVTLPGGLFEKKPEALWLVCDKNIVRVSVTPKDLFGVLDLPSALFRVNVVKAGSSLRMSIPKTIAKKSGLRAGMELVCSAEKSGFVLRRSND